MEAHGNFVSEFFKEIKMIEQLPEDKLKVIRKKLMLKCLFNHITEDGVRIACGSCAEYPLCTQIWNIILEKIKREKMQKIKSSTKFYRELNQIKLKAG